jgi:hypothetical protein
MQMIFRALLVTFIMTTLFESLAASADAPTTEKGIATLAFSGPAPSAKDYRDTESAAELNAIRRYVAMSTDAESRNFQRIRGYVSTHLAKYVLGASVVSRQVDSNAKTLTVVLRVDIDTSALANTFHNNSAVDRTVQTARSYITFIFVARQQASITRYGPQTSNVQGTLTTENGETNSALTNTGAAFADQHTRISRVRTDESTTQRAIDVRYRVAASDPVNTAMTSVFSDAGYRVVPAQFLEADTNDLIDPTAFERDFSHGNDISGKTLANAVLGARQAHIRYLAVGTLDEGVSNTDPQTGLIRVFVTVTGTLYDLGGPFPQTLVSVGPEQYSGLGPTESVAETNALELAARTAAQKMAQGMAASNVH